MVAADTDRLALEDSTWSHGAFTHCLLKGLAGEADGFQGIGPQDGVVTLLELRAYLESTMPADTLKNLQLPLHPVIKTSTTDPSIWELTLAEN